MKIVQCGGARSVVSVFASCGRRQQSGIKRPDSWSWEHVPQGTPSGAQLVVLLMVVRRESSGLALWFHSHQSETSLGLCSGKRQSLRWSPQPSHINTPFKGLLSHTPHGGRLPDP